MAAADLKQESDAGSRQPEGSDKSVGSWIQQSLVAFFHYSYTLVIQQIARSDVERTEFGGGEGKVKTAEKAAPKVHVFWRSDDFWTSTAFLDIVIRQGEVFFTEYEQAILNVPLIRAEFIELVASTGVSCNEDAASTSHFVPEAIRACCFLDLLAILCLQSCHHVVNVLRKEGSRPSVAANPEKASETKASEDLKLAASEFESQEATETARLARFLNALEKASRRVMQDRRLDIMFCKVVTRFQAKDCVCTQAQEKGLGFICPGYRHLLVKQKAVVSHVVSSLL
jgi:hypothetical protein